MKWLTSFSGKVQLLETMKIILVDDHSILLDGLKKLIQDDEMLTVVDAVDNLPDAIRSIDKHKPDLVITDYNLGEDDGLSLVQKVKRILPETKFIVLSMHDESHLVKALNMGHTVQTVQTVRFWGTAQTVQTVPPVQTHFLSEHEDSSMTT